MSVAVTRPDRRPALRLVSGGGRPLRVAVLGGGITGLAAAHFLAKAGHRPIVFEASPELGVLVTDFEHLGTRLDRWPRVVRPDDSELLAVIAEVGLADQLQWSDTAAGVILDGRLYGLDTPVDLMRFRALSPSDRLRTGLAALYVAAVGRGGAELDDVLAVDWLHDLFGPRAFDRLWDPLLRAKFGDPYGDLPAYWVWHRLRREWNGTRGTRGTLRCGHHGLATALRDAVLRHGGRVRPPSSIEVVEENPAGILVGTGAGGERFDAVLSSLPLPLLAGVTRGALSEAIPLPDLRYRAVVNAVVVSRRRLERFYATAVKDTRFPFQSVVETTHVIPPEWLDGRHLAYVTSCCDTESERYQSSDDVVAGQAMAGLGAVYPNFRRREVEAVYVFRAPHAEPVCTVGHLRRRPAPRVGQSRLYICDGAQAYPQTTAWNANTGVALAAQSVTCLLDDLARTRVAVS